MVQHKIEKYKLSKVNWCYFPIFPNITKTNVITFLKIGELLDLNTANDYYRQNYYVRNRIVVNEKKFNFLYGAICEKIQIIIPSMCNYVHILSK